MVSLAVLGLCQPAVAAAQHEAGATEATAHSTAQAQFDALLAADRAAAADGERRGLDGLLAAMAKDVLMPVPRGRHAIGLPAVEDALRTDFAYTLRRLSWAPLGGGLSGDGMLGFTYGYMQGSGEGGPGRSLKYLALWTKGGGGWKIAAFKRAPHPDGIRSKPIAPILPSATAAPVAEGASDERAGLIAREKAFSDEAAAIGLGPAFVKFGTPESINLGSSAAFTVGSDNIGRELEKGNFPPLVWSADGARVAGSGDLGMTWGYIRVAGDAGADGPGISFFTIWQRSDRSAPWHYIAE